MTERQHDIVEQTKRLDGIANELESKVTALREQINGVLLPEPVSPPRTQDNVKDPQPILSPLGLVLHDIARGLEHVNALLADTLRRNQL